MTEAQPNRRTQRQRERRARKQQDHQLTAIVAALGAGDCDDWPQDEQPKRRKGQADDR